MQFHRPTHPALERATSPRHAVLLTSASREHILVNWNKLIAQLPGGVNRLDAMPCSQAAENCRLAPANFEVS